MYKKRYDTEAGSLIMKLLLSIVLLMLFAVGMSFDKSYAHNDPQGVERIPVAALKGGGMVYSAFVDYLNKNPHDNDFTKFASNPENYTVSIRVHGDKFVYTFTLNSYRGGPVLGGPISFSWSEASGRIDRTLQP